MKLNSRFYILNNDHSKIQLWNSSIKAIRQPILQATLWALGILRQYS